MSVASEYLLYFAPLLYIVVFLIRVVRSDVKRFKIPNIDVLFLVAGGCLYTLFAPGGQGALEWQLPGSAGLKNHLLSFGITLAIGFVLFVLKLWGAGDAKLLAALAIWMPYQQMPMLLIHVMVFGGAVALVRIIKNGNAKVIIKNIQSIVLFRLAGLSNAAGFQTADRVPFSIAIAGGWLSLVIAKFFGF